MQTFPAKRLEWKLSVFTKKKAYESMVFDSKNTWIFFAYKWFFQSWGISVFGYQIYTYDHSSAKSLSKSSWKYQK